MSSFLVILKAWSSSPNRRIGGFLQQAGCRWTSAALLCWNCLRTRSSGAPRCMWKAHSERVRQAAQWGSGCVSLSRLSWSTAMCKNAFWNMSESTSFILASIPNNQSCPMIRCTEQSTDVLESECAVQELYRKRSLAVVALRCQVAGTIVLKVYFFRSLGF